MAMTKTGIAFRRPVQVYLPPTKSPEVGEERNGRVWDGERWVSPEDWERVQRDRSEG